MEADRVTTAEGDIPAAATIWTTGFSVHPIARATTLQTGDTGQIEVDATMRSVSHPDVYAIGDAALVTGPGDKPLRMSCASGIPTAWQAADAIAARLTDGKLPTISARYFNQCISLGRKEGLIQYVTADDRAVSAALTGRLAAFYKELVCKGAAWGVANPTMGLPTRRRRTTSEPPRRALQSPPPKRLEVPVQDPPEALHALRALGAPLRQHRDTGGTFTAEQHEETGCLQILPVHRPLDSEGHPLAGTDSAALIGHHAALPVRLHNAEHPAGLGAQSPQSAPGNDGRADHQGDDQHRRRHTDDQTEPGQSTDRHHRPRHRLHPPRPCPQRARTKRLFEVRDGRPVDEHHLRSRAGASADVRAHVGHERFPTLAIHERGS